jgi:hypothetical protein
MFLEIPSGLKNHYHDLFDDKLFVEQIFPVIFLDALKFMQQLH